MATQLTSDFIGNTVVSGVSSSATKERMTRDFKNSGIIGRNVNMHNAMKQIWTRFQVGDALYHMESSAGPAYTHKYTGT